MTGVLPTDPAALEFLEHGRIDVQGRIVSASNATLFCAITADGVEAECVYKPISGERPLWDFPDGTLAGRELATYLVDAATGFGVVPPTVLRDGPFGPGMVQLWVHTDEDVDLVDVVAPDDVPEGWRVVLHAQDRLGEPAVLAHADHPALRMMAALDVVVNNTDRKGGHVLNGDTGVFGVDHGICLHEDSKLRTVLWGFMNEPLGTPVVEGLERLVAATDDELAATLATHLTPPEIRALRLRTRRLLAKGVYPEPGQQWRVIPWPPF